MAPQIPHLASQQINIPGQRSTVHSRSGGGGSAGNVTAYLPHSPLKPIDVSSNILTQGGLRILGSSAQGFLRYSENKAEIARKAAVLEQRPIVGAYFDKIKNDFEGFKGTDAAAIPQLIADMKPDIYDRLIPVDSDAKTKNDLTQILNSQYDKLLGWGYNYRVAQFDIADKVAMERIDQELVTAAVNIPPGSDIRALHGIVKDAGDKYAYLHSDVPQETLEAIRVSNLNRAASVMMQSWMVESPSTAESYFVKNKAILREIMKADFPRIAKQMDGISDEAQKDRAISLALQESGGDKYDSAAKFGDAIWLGENFSDSEGSIDYTGAMSIQNALYAQADSDARRVERAQNQNEDRAYTKILKDHFNPKTGNVDYANAIPALHKAFRLGEISSAVYERSLSNWTQRVFTPEDRRMVYAGIRSGELNSYAKISAMMKGNEGIIQYTNLLDRVTKDKALNKKIDWYERAEKYWDAVATTASGKEGTYVMPIETKEDFFDELTEWMIANDKTHLDREVLMTAREMLLATSKYDGKLTVYPPGEYPSDMWLGPDYARQWQWRNFGTEQDQQNRGESVITPNTAGGTAAVDSAPAIQTATSGNAIDMDVAAVELLKSAGKPVTPEYIEIAKAKIADDMRVADEESGRVSPAVAAESEEPEQLNETQIKMIKEAIEDESLSEDERRQLREILKKANILIGD